MKITNNLKSLTMKKLILILTLSSLLLSCSNGGNSSNSNTPTTNVPIGTTVKLEVSSSSGNIINSIEYKDAQQNTIYLFNVPNNWTKTFQTTTNNQNILLISDVGIAHNLTGYIYINGTLMKTANGSSIVMNYP